MVTTKTLAAVAGTAFILFFATRHRIIVGARSQRLCANDTFGLWPQRAMNEMNVSRVNYNRNATKRLLSAGVKSMRKVRLLFGSQVSMTN